MRLYAIGTHRLIYMLFLLLFPFGVEFTCIYPNRKRRLKRGKIMIWMICIVWLVWLV